MRAAAGLGAGDGRRRQRATVSAAGAAGNRKRRTRTVGSAGTLGGNLPALGVLLAGRGWRGAAERLLLATVVLLAGLLLVGPAVQDAGAQGSRRAYDYGQEVVPAYEGWEQNPDGSFNLVFGTMNRNWEEELHIPIGPDNHIEPGGPDQGQPTWFLPRRNRFLFRIRVPADFGDRELVWTLTSHGETKRAYGTLLPDYYMDDNVRMANNGAGVSGELFKNVAPTLEVHGESTRTVKANAPVTVTAVAHDEDGLPRRRRMRPVDPGRPTSLTPIAATGLRLSWFVYRGAVPVTFDPVQTKVWEDTRANSNSPWGAGWETPEPPPHNEWVVQATFSEPGTYVLRCIAHDGALATYEDVTFVVTE